MNKSNEWKSVKYELPNENDIPYTTHVAVSCERSVSDKVLIVTKDAEVYTAFFMHTGKRHPYFDYHGESEREIRQMVNFLVDSVPSAEKTGEWIVNPNDGRPSGWKCNQCGFNGDSWDSFCRHCGADMRGNIK